MKSKETTKRVIEISLSKLLGILFILPALTLILGLRIASYENEKSYDDMILQVQQVTEDPSNQPVVLFIPKPTLIERSIFWKNPVLEKERVYFDYEWDGDQFKVIKRGELKPSETSMKGIQKIYYDIKEKF